jgi:hypothetical protein
VSDKHKTPWGVYQSSALWLVGLALLGVPAWSLIWRISQRETLDAGDPMFLVGCVLAVLAPLSFLGAVRAIRKELLEAGWEFWVVSFVATLGPCLFLALRITNESAKRLAPISFGFIMAAFGAGLFSWAANTVIQRRAEQNRKREKKQARKQK